jgi:hypothetical protein
LATGAASADSAKVTTPVVKRVNTVIKVKGKRTPRRKPGCSIMVSIRGI